MGFNAASLVATIRLDGVEKVDRDLGKVRNQLRDTDGAASKVTKAINAGFTSAAVSIAAGGIAAGVLVGKLVSTGVAYNTLQQTSRAALGTLLGGAEAANAQMDKLDAFARNSPFSKSVFISAQQQLIGFGFEAEKVIPILDAVQNAVAAVGGSNEQISDIVAILAKIRSSGKLTGEDFNMLGERGLDAATLLGEGFGKTAAEIRESVTAGTLDAGQAIDVLVTQMDKKFAGASANVKNTFSGTIDRIKAASRDIGAALAEPFVSKNGGGLAVTWGNQLADVMRAVEKHVAPVVSILVDRATPAFRGFTELLDRAVVHIKAWDSSKLETGLDGIASYAPGIAAVAGAIVGTNTALLRGIPVIGPWLGILGPLSGAIAGVVAVSPELRSALGDLLGAFQPLVPAGAELAQVIAESIASAVPLATSVIEGLTAVLKPMIEFATELPAPLLLGAGAFLLVYANVKKLIPMLVAGAAGLKAFAATSGATTTMRAFNAGLSPTSALLAGATTGVTNFGNAMKAAFISNPIGIALLAITGAVAGLTMLFAAQAERAAAVREKVAQYRDTLVSTTGEVTNATREMADAALDGRASWLGFDLGSHADTAKKLGLSLETVTEAMLGNADAMAEVDAALESDIALREVSSAALLGFSDTVKMNAEAVQQATKDTLDNAEAERQRAAAMTDTERVNNKINEALGILRDTSADATTKLKALNQILDLINGGTQTEWERGAALTDQANRLAEAFAAVDENGNLLAPGLIGVTGAIDNTTTAGTALGNEVIALNEQMKLAVINANAASEAEHNRGLTLEETAGLTAEYAEKLRAVATEAGVGAEQVNAMVAAMLTSPEELFLTVSSDGTVDAETGRILDLTQAILDTPDGNFTIDDSDVPKVMEMLRLLGVDITTLPLGTVKVAADDGTFTTLESKLAHLARNREAVISVITPAGAYDGPLSPTWPGKWNGDIVNARAFSNGGFASGIYAGVMGGIPKMGVDGRPHLFAEKHLGVDWETYISSKASRTRNVGLLHETARRIGAPMVEIAALRGFRGYDNGGTVGTATPSPVEYDDSPLVGGDVNFITEDSTGAMKELNRLYRRRKQGGRRGRRR